MNLITSSELKKRLDHEDLLLIDVRETWEHEEQNIGAKNIPLCELPNCINELEKYKGKEIIIHCQSGKRSNQAQKFLTKNGFKFVRSLDGGLQAFLIEE